MKEQDVRRHTNVKKHATTTKTNRKEDTQHCIVKRLHSHTQRRRLKHAYQ